MKRKKSKKPRCRVYAVELGPREVYVGATRKTPAERFREHRAGGKTSSGVVRRRGRRLRPDLSRGFADEKQLAASLRRRGFSVRGATRRLSAGLALSKKSRGEKCGCHCSRCEHKRGRR